MALVPGPDGWPDAYAYTLAEFEWRFNNRENLAAMIPLLATASARTRPATYNHLKWADYGA